MQPRILMILPRIPFPARDGAEVVMLETLKALADRGLSVHVFALNPSRQRRDPNLLRPYCASSMVVNINTDVNKLTLLRSLVFPPRVDIGTDTLPLSYWMSRFVDPNAIEELHRFVRVTGPFDVVHCETLFTSIYGLLLAQEPNRPVVVYRSHNVEWRIQERLSHEPGSSMAQRYVRRKLAKQTLESEKWIAQRVDAIATISKHDGDWYRSTKSSTLMQVVHPGVTIPAEPQAQCGNHTIGFLGSLDWEPNRKGLSWFLDHVLPLIQEHVPDVQCHIAGRGSQSFCQQRSMPEGVQCVGEVDSVADFYEKQSIAIAPLLSGSGVRIKLLESFALGKPVVTTAQGAEGLEIRQGEECMIADTPKAFASACVELLQDQQLRSKLGKAARSFVQKTYSWEQAGAELSALYDKCLKRF